MLEWCFMKVIVHSSLIFIINSQFGRYLWLVRFNPNVFLKVVKSVDSFLYGKQVIVWLILNAQNLFSCGERVLNTMHVVPVWYKKYIGRRCISLMLSVKTFCWDIINIETKEWWWNSNLRCNILSSLSKSMHVSPFCHVVPVFSSICQPLPPFCTPLQL